MAENNKSRLARAFRKHSMAWGLLVVGGAIMVAGLSRGWESLIESQIFYPDRQMASTPREYGLDYEDLFFITPDGVRLHGWLVPASDPKALVLFAHGNAGNISHRLDNVSRLNRLNLSVLIFDYRGYGRSQGRISEKGMYLDAQAAFDLARERATQENLKLVIFGRSLGGAAAIQLASEYAPARDAAGLILESTFTTLADMAGLHFPLAFAGRAVKGKMDSLGRIKGIKITLLFFHGDRDDLVPLELGRRLFQAAPPPKELVVIKGAGHNDTYLKAGKPYFEKWASFAAGL